MYFWVSDTKESKKTLVVGMMSGWAPFMTINAKGDYEGFDVDVAQEVAKRLDRLLIVQDLGSLASCFIALDQQRIDMMLSDLDITQMRREKMAMIRYSGQDVTQYKLIFWNEIPENIKTMNDMRNFPDAVVCIESGSAQEKFLDGYKFVTKKRVNSLVDIVLDLRFGKSLAAVVEPGVAARLQRQNSEIKSIFVDLPQDFQVFGCGIAINKKNTELIVKTQAIIDQMYADGTLKMLEQKWQVRE